ncbi:MAG: carboxypeptidase regulatory-like domain-containing protein [Bacteroidetes bacterium]|nr:carboxypeptidase regulatory-like domain-containing protein [Bacteroidota bacterium]
MLDAELLTLTKFNTVWSGNPVMVAAVGSLQAKVNSINTQDQAQKASTKGITMTKEQAKTAMIDLAYSHIVAGKAYATATNNTLLKETLHYSHSDLKKLKDTDCDDVCQIVKDAVSPFIASMANYGATAATLTALQNGINAFSAMIGKPRSQKAATVVATKTIDQYIRETRTINKESLDLIIEQYKTINPAFYKEYKSARMIVDIGSHFTTVLMGLILDENGPIENAVVKVRDTTKFKKTDAKGSFKFLGLAEGGYVVEVTAPNNKAVSVKVKVTEKDVSKVEIKLERILSDDAIG